MRLELSDGDPTGSSADLLCLPACEGEALPDWLAGAPGAADVRSGYRELTLLRPGAPARVLVVGLGAREDLDPERARVAAALAAREAGRLGARDVDWVVPDHPRKATIGAALTAGTILAGYRFDRFKRAEEGDRTEGVAALTLLGSADPDGHAEVARVAAEAANRARDLQNLPANVADPAYLAARAAEIAAGIRRSSSRSSAPPSSSAPGWAACSPSPPGRRRSRR
jgi:leucyl aminopeptidase